MLNTKLLMTASAALMGVTGLAATFLPVEIVASISANNRGGALPLLVQLLGALYLGFAMLNWTAKDSSMGGIYGRPLVIGNLVHFVVGALALLKAIPAGHEPRIAVVAFAAVYATFAIAFAKVMFTSPVKSGSGSAA